MNQRFVKSFSHGQITIPKEFREHLRLSDEFWLQLAIADNKIIAEPVMTGRDDADSGSFASRLLKIKGDWFDIGDWKKVRKEAGKRLAGN